MLKRMSVLICVAAFALTTAGYAYAQGDAAADAATTASVKTKLLADTKVGGLAIDVDTKDNVVTLSGKVRTAAEKTEAVRLARTTTGVKSVVDKLVIDPAYKGATTKDEKAKAEMKDEAKDAKGTAGRTADKTKEVSKDATQATKDAAVKSKDVTADASITSAVKTRLLADPLVGGLKIDVDTKDNVVTLTGNVKSAAERDEAVRLAKTTTGVKNVVSKLTIKP